MSPADFDVSDVRQSYSFTIPVNIPSANEMKRHMVFGRNSKHWYTGLKGTVSMAIKVAGHGVPKATGPRRVTITRLIDRYGKRFDHDNLVTGCKMLLDAMVEFGLLTNDTERDVTVTYAQEKQSGGGTRIEVEDQ